MGFSVSTLERGIAKLEEAKLMSHRRILRNPRTNRRLQGPRNLYFNNFDSLSGTVTLVEADDFDDFDEGLIRSESSYGIETIRPLGALHLWPKGTVRFFTVSVGGADVRVTQVHIEGFRCLADLKVDFDDLTALVGSGGAVS